MGWYAIFVMTGKEELVKEEIDRIMSCSETKITYQLIIAKREINERKNGNIRSVIKKLFPGYILLETDNITELYHLIKNCEYLIDILRRGEYFSEIKLEEIANIVYMADDDGVIGNSDIYVENDRIIVTKGPLKNYDGFIKKIDKRKQRITVLFFFNNKEHFIDLSINIIEKFDDKKIGKTIPFFAYRYYQLK